MLTTKQAATLRFFGAKVKTAGVAPTLREVAEGTGVGKVTAFEHMAHLVAKGYLEKAVEPYRARGHRLTKRGHQWLKRQRNPLKEIKALWGVLGKDDQREFLTWTEST